MILKDHKLLKHGGAWYTINFNGEDIKFQSKEFNDMMEKNIELKEYLYEQICEHQILKYKSIPAGIDDVEITTEVFGDE